MAKAEYIRPVEALHGKLKKSDKVGFAKRKASGTKFTVTRDDWSLKISADKQASVNAHRAKFRAVAASARERMQDPTKRIIDKQGFANQSKYTTMFGYCFHLEWLAFDGE